MIEIMEISEKEHGKKDDRKGKKVKDDPSTPSTSIFHPKFIEYKLGNAKLDDTPAYQFKGNKDMKYQEPITVKVNFRKEGSLEMMVEDNWNPTFKAIVLKILEYTDTFAWPYKYLKGLPLELSTGFPWYLEHNQYKEDHI